MNRKLIRMIGAVPLIAAVTLGFAVVSTSRIPCRAIGRQFLQSFGEFPPRAKPGSFNLDQVLQKIQLPSPN